MKYIDEFRDGELARTLASAIAREARPGRSYNLMEFCGGHTHAISRYGLTDLLPANVNMIHGPGCPVCVLPIGRIDNAIELAARPGLVLCTYADTMRVPASKGTSLLKAKARGADIRMIYSSADAVRIAQENPGGDVVFFAIGFETTTPPTAVAITQAMALGLANFSVFCNHVLTPAAISNILESKEVRELGTVPLDGFVGPAHVSTVIGSQPGRAEVENEFTRAVTREGNAKAKALVAEVFELRRSFEWRGLGEVPYSALRIKEKYAAFDAEARYGITYRSVPDNKACECGAILRGIKKPADCKVFGTVCTPENPIGSCMVSSEGACAAHYTYGRFKDVPVVAAGTATAAA
jgi:hydrogenase expression/formation protein HypD